MQNAMKYQLGTHVHHRAMLHEVVTGGHDHVLSIPPLDHWMGA
jgi:hypothetical protein